MLTCSGARGRLAARSEVGGYRHLQPASAVHPARHCFSITSGSSPVMAAQPAIDGDHRRLRYVVEKCSSGVGCGGSGRRPGTHLSLSWEAKSRGKRVPSRGTRKYQWVKRLCRHTRHITINYCSTTCLDRGERCASGTHRLRRRGGPCTPPGPRPTHPSGAAAPQHAGRSAPPTPPRP